jgi:uncharacterized BrkB/YihY/UPF0761 family membrane protein
MLAYFATDLGWGELLKRTAKERQADNGLGLAAQLAYYFFLALFPTLLFLIALAGVFATQGRQGPPAPAPAHAPVGVVQQPRTSPAAAYGRTGVLFGGLITALFGRRIRD